MLQHTSIHDDLKLTAADITYARQRLDSAKNDRQREVLAVHFVRSPVRYRRSSFISGLIMSSTINGINKMAYVSFSNEGEILDAVTLGVSNVYGGEGDDHLIASPAGSLLVGHGGSNKYTGDSGDDVFVISASDDTRHIQGNGGRDTVLIVGDKGVRLNMGRSGIIMAQGGRGDDIIVSGSNNSVFIKEGCGNTTLIGGGGDDMLVGGSGKNKIVGGKGKAVIYAGPQGDIIYAAEQGSIIYAGSGRDHIYGGVSDDVIEAGHGNAFIDGGGGINVVTLHGSHNEYHITRTHNGFQAVDKIARRDGTLTLKNIQRINFSDISAVELGGNNIIPVDDRVLTDRYGSPLGRNRNVRFLVADLLANDLHFGDDSQLYIAALTDAVGCKVRLNGENIEFFPDKTFAGMMSFKYEVKDANGQVSSYVSDLTTGEMVAMRATVNVVTEDIPSDPLLIQQGYLNEINVFPVWQDYTGKGIRIGQFEPGEQFATQAEIFDIRHPDLTANVDPDWLQTHTKTGILPPGVSNHATMVAGVMVAARNDFGVVGVAYDATLGGHYLSSDGADFTQLEKMFSYDVVNHSWGVSNEFSLNNGPVGAVDLTSTLKAMFHDAAARGRGGLGTIIVTVGGNQREDGGSAQGSLINNSRFAIQVGAINKLADLSTLKTATVPFSNPGCSLLVSAPGSHVFSSSVGLKTQQGMEFSSEYSTGEGTSFAAPMVSGVAALMLEANPNLGYRDVQQIFALSACEVKDPATQWHTNGATHWNGGGMHVSHDYGFGVVDARAAVRLAETWIGKNTDDNQIVIERSYGGSEQSLNAGNMASVSIAMNSGMNVEHVEVDFSANVGRLGDVTITLVSPEGSESILLDRAGKKPAGNNDADIGNTISGDFNYTFMSNYYRGEHSAGQWRLSVTDANNGLPVKLNSGSLRLFGSKKNPDDIYFYTNEFVTNVAKQPQRSVLDDAINGTVGGRNTLNTAAISGDVVIDLARGRANLAGSILTIRNADTIHNLISGDGNDSLTAGRHNSLLDGGRGDNILTGGAGKELFVVRKRKNGNDTLYNFEASKGEVIQLVGFTQKEASEWRVSQYQNDTVINLSNSQSIIIKNQPLEALRAQHFTFQSTFVAPTSYVNSHYVENNQPAGKPTIMLLSGGRDGVSFSTDADDKMKAVLTGKTYRRDSAQASIFVLTAQENTLNYRNALSGFRHGIDKIDVSDIGIRHFSELAIIKKNRATINGLSLIPSVEITSNAPNVYLNPDGKNISLLYLDGLDISQLSAEDFIFANVESMKGDALFADDDIAQLLNMMPTLEDLMSECEGIYSSVQTPQAWLTNTPFSQIPLSSHC